MELIGQDFGIYNGVIFSQPTSYSMKQIIELIINNDKYEYKRIEYPDNIVRNDYHITYKTKTIFHNLPKDIAIEIQRELDTDASYFLNYHIYFSFFNINNIPTFIVLIKQKKLADEIFDNIDIRTQGLNRVYKLVDIDKLCETIYKNEFICENIEIPVIQYTVFDEDGYVTGIKITGKDVVNPNSNTISLLQKPAEMKMKGPRTSISMCKVKYTLNKIRILLSANVMGMYTIFLTKNGSNLHLLSDLIVLLEKNKMVLNSNDKPKNTIYK